MHNYSLDACSLLAWHLFTYNSRAKTINAKSNLQILIVFRFIILFWWLWDWTLTKHCIPPSVWDTPFTSCLFKLHPFPKSPFSPLIGQLKHAWPSTANNNRAAVMDRFLQAKLASEARDCANVWRGVMSRRSIKLALWHHNRFEA